MSDTDPIYSMKAMHDAVQAERERCNAIVGDLSTSYKWLCMSAMVVGDEARILHRVQRDLKDIQTAISTGKPRAKEQP
jgi:hypothetical protein